MSCCAGVARRHNPGTANTTPCHAGLKFKLRMANTGRRVTTVTLAMKLIGQGAAARKLKMGWKVGHERGGMEPGAASRH